MTLSIAQNISKPGALMTGVIMICLAIGVLVGVLPSLIVYVGNLSTISGLGFSSFFATGGIVLLAIGAAVVLGILGALGIGGSKR